MKIDPKDFRVPTSGKFKLKRWPTDVKPYFGAKKAYEDALAGHVQQLSSLQEVLYASDQRALLLIFQAMDTAGKDGAIAHVMSGVNPQGCEVHSFKRPSAEELQHDFLWRASNHLPERGRIGIFNRSYYEEVLVVRVHPELLQNEGETEMKPSEKLWQKRFQSIVDFEKHLHLNGTTVVKFFLHLSKEEQRKRLLARIDDPNKNWKFEAGDLKERALWDEYQHAYEACIAETASDHAPWYIVPADEKKNARLIISQVIVETLREMKLKYPVLSKDGKKRLGVLRKELTR